MKVINSFFLLFFVLILGCKKNENPVNQNENSVDVIMSLKVGNQWTYIDSTFDQKETFVRIDTSKLGITGKTNISHNGKSYEAFYWNWIDIHTNRPGDGKWLCGNEVDGLYFYGGRYLDSNFVLGRSLNAKYPVSVGDSWQNVNYSYSLLDSSFKIVDTTLITCTSVKEKINTFLGEMDCYVYHSQRTVSNYTYDTYLYFVKNVGYVGATFKTNGIIRSKKVLKANELLKYSYNNNEVMVNNNESNKYLSPFDSK